MTTILSPSPVQKFFDNNGNPLNQGQLFSYQAGTAVPLSTYTDSTGSTPNPNPTILNARGEANIWIPPNVAYKFTLQDSLGNQIWSVDQIVNSQLLTLYGGVDTGSANAYVLNFTANFASLSNGIIIYWVPSNTNTGASTLNVNGLGTVNIVNPTGSAIGSGQIIAGAPVGVLYYNGTWILFSSSLSAPVINTFAGVYTSGGNTSVATCKYSIFGNTCTLLLGYGNLTIISGLTMTGLPSVCQPLSTTATCRVPIASNNGSAIDTCIAQIQPSSGTITFSTSAAGYPASGWSGVAQIGLHVGLFNYTNTVSYALF